MFDDHNNVSTKSEKFDITPPLDAEPEETLSNADTRAPESIQNQQPDSDAYLDHGQNNEIAISS